MSELQWQKLLERLKEKYRLKQVCLEIETRPIELMKVENIDDLLDQVNDPDEIPFWAELWPASIGLATAILRNPSLWRGKTVLELGSGVGLAGIAATMAGAEVTQSDFLEDAFDFIRVNRWRNGIDQTSLLLADWRHFPERAGTFDRVIGADILYEKTLHDPLAAVLHRVIRRDGFVWLADPGRVYGRDFVQKQTDADWKVRQSQINVDYQEKPYVIDLYQMTPPGTI